MTIFAGPFTTGNMDQPQWEEVESKMWSDGVISGARNGFATTTTTGLGISVASGDAILDGFRFYSDAATALTAAAADPSLPRIDLLVLRIDESGHTSTIALKTGTPAASPVAPTATKTAGGTYELGIYQVRVNAGATSITSLTDVRGYTQPTLQGKSIGNASGNIPLSNGTLNVNLNADLLDGLSSAAFAQLTGAAFTGDVTTTGQVAFGATVGGAQSNVHYDAGISALVHTPPQAGAGAQYQFFQTWNGSARVDLFSMGAQVNSARLWLDTNGTLRTPALALQSQTTYMGFKDSAGNKIGELKNGSITIGGHTVFNGDGNGSTVWTGGSFDAFDVAELYPVDQQYPGGTVVCPGPDGRFTRCTHERCGKTLLVSERPALRVGWAEDADEGGSVQQYLAIAGRLVVQTEDLALVAGDWVCSDGAGGVRGFRPGERGQTVGFVIARAQEGRVGIVVRATYHQQEESDE